MIRVKSAAPVKEAKGQFRWAVFHLNPDPAGPAGIGVDMDVGQGLVDSGQHAGSLRRWKAGVEGPFFRQGAESMETGWGELDLERGFRGGGSRIHAGQSLGTGAGTGWSVPRIFSSDGRRGTGPPKMRRCGLRATVAMKVLP